MTQPTRILSNRMSDYQKVRSETVSLVTALSNSLSGLGSVQPGISLIYPAEGMAEEGRAFTRIFFVAPIEIAKNSVGDAVLADRLREIVATTPIRFDAKRNEQLFLDANSQEYISLQHRLMPILQAASSNFRKEIADLIELFDSFTQPSSKVPTGSTYHIRAAFQNRELLDAYRVANNLLIPPPPTLTAEVRDMLTRRGVSTHGISDRGAGASPEAVVGGLLHAALPNNAALLREAAQGSQHGREVQMILHVLGEAIVRKEIPNLVMDQNFREALARVIADARPAAAQLASAHPQISPVRPQ